MFLSYRVKFRVRVRSGADVRDGSFRGGEGGGRHSRANVLPSVQLMPVRNLLQGYLVNAGEGANEERSGLDKCYLQTGARVAES